MLLSIGSFIWVVFNYASIAQSGWCDYFDGYVFRLDNGNYNI